VAAIVWELLSHSPVVFSYEDFGDEYVSTLLARDRTRLVKCFGLPRRHQDPFEVIRPLWDSALAEYTRRVDAQHRETQAEFGRPLDGLG
jgi:hypothetical protein